ncbi:unnamed protein product [Cunninghamella echinulata]
MEKGAELLAENAEVIAEEIIRIVNEMIEAYNTVDGDSKALAKKLEMVKSIADNLKRCKGMPTDLHLKDLLDELKASKEAIDEFNEREKLLKSPSFFRRQSYRIKRFLIYAPEYKEQFNSCMTTLDELPKEMQRITELAAVLLSPTALGYGTKFVNDACKKFWLDIMGNTIGGEGGSGAWNKFQTNYKQEFPTAKDWTTDQWECVKRVACYLGNDLTLFGYFELTSTTGFPIDINKVPTILDSNADMEEASRIEIGKMIKELIGEFSSEEMNTHIVNVHKWYSSFPKEVDTQERANECYRIIKRVREENPEKYTEREQLALDVDKARRVVSFFYQEFLVICEFGRLSRNIFANVDFPGKGRMRSFIEKFKPLDKANFKIIIKNDEYVPQEKLDKAVPKVYKFLERFLDIEDEIKIKKEDWEKKFREKEAEFRSKETAIKFREAALKARQLQIQSDLQELEELRKWKESLQKKDKKQKKEDNKTDKENSISEKKNEKRRKSIFDSREAK